MLLLIHNAGNFISASHQGKKISSGSSGLVASIWEYAELYPNEIIGWCDEALEEYVNFESWNEVFCHDLIMASYSIQNSYLPESIGYIDQLPFVNVNRNVPYATWRMSRDVGGIKGEALLKFKTLLSGIKNFNFLINSIAKLGQQNGLFCYSEPKLIKREFLLEKSILLKSHEASTKDLFAFVASHYRKKRLLLLFWCFIKYEKEFPAYPFLLTLFRKPLLGQNVDLSNLNVNRNKTQEKDFNIDVIIPTLGRPKYLLDVLKDLSTQTLLPKKVIVVEQNPDPESNSELPQLQGEKWPFKIIHHFIHETGACNARNLALDEVDSKWVFFADDDNKMNEGLIENALNEIYRYNLDSLTIHYPQREEELIFEKIKQWGTFGAGNSIVAKEFASKIRFDHSFEHGYGEDKDYGMQLRNSGCDIVYHPNLKILHLKAPIGGFREDLETPWEKDKPKPSPTLMLYAKKYFTAIQIKGFKEELFIRYYSKQKLINPFRYYRSMKKRWEKSEIWSEKIVKYEEKRLQNFRDTI